MTEQQQTSANASCLQVITDLFGQLYRREIDPQKASEEMEKRLGGLWVYIPNHNSGRITKRIIVLIRSGRTTDEIYRTIGCTKQYICKVRRRLKKGPAICK